MRKTTVLFQRHNAITSLHIEGAALRRSRGLNDFLRINRPEVIPARSC